MSFWYEPKKDDIDITEDGKDMHIYLGTDPAWDDCGNIYCSVKVKDVKDILDDKEICICAAIRMEDGYIIKGHRHCDCIRIMSQIPRYKKSWAHGENQGFVTSKNRYVDRIEGAKLQKAAGIKSKMPEGQEYLHGELYSEDLY